MAETPFGSPWVPSAIPDRHSSNNQEYLHNGYTSSREDQRDEGIGEGEKEDYGEEEGEGEEDQEAIDYTEAPQNRDFYALLNVPRDV